MYERDFLTSKVYVSTAVDFDFQVFQGKKVLIVTDETVANLYLEQVSVALACHAQQVFSHVLPCGEEAKSIEHLQSIYDTLLTHQFGRQDCILALGGGVVSDVAGFAASTYMRGMGYYAMPTTLLSQVDSAYGGKCGMNYAGKKNMIGSFYQPKAIFVCTGFLNTLSAELLQDGYGEIIKYGFIYDNTIWNTLEQCVKENDFTQVVLQSISAKYFFVDQDEHDLGKRTVLNFGHTVGHAVEAFSNYGISHGKAVAIGILYAIKIGIALGVTSEDLLAIAQKILEKYEFIVDYAFSSETIYDIIITDKKAHGNSIKLVLLSAVMQPCLLDVPFDTLSDVLKKLN